MIFFKKFYDITDTDTGGGDTAIAEKTETKEAPISFAAEMAKSGSRATNGNEAAKPIVNTENKEETKTDIKATPDATSNEPLPTAKATTESPAKTEPAKATPPPIAEVPKQAQSWQEVLKSQPNEVFKELGFDDESVDILNEIKDYKDKGFFKQFLTALKDGNANEYVKEWNTDYSKMSAEEVMRHQLQAEYPKAKPAALNALYEDEIVNKYNLDSEDEDLSAKGRLLLEAKADKYRDTLIANQQTKLAPRPPEAKAPPVDNSAAEQAQEYEAYKNKISSDPYYKDLNASNEIVLGKGENKVTLPVAAQELSDLVLDYGKFSKALWKRDENDNLVPDVEKQILVAAVAKYGKDFLIDIAKKYKSLGGKAVAESIENAKQPNTPIVPHNLVIASNLAEGMAKGGMKVTGAM